MKDQDLANSNRPGNPGEPGTHGPPPSVPPGPPDPPPRPDPPDTGPDVVIDVNGTDYRIHRGSQTVAFIKQVAGVPAADQLHLLGPDGAPVDLDQGGRVVLKGGEKFVSFVASGSAS